MPSEVHHRRADATDECDPDEPTPPGAMIVFWLAPGFPPVDATECARVELLERYGQVDILTVWATDFSHLDDTDGIAPLWLFTARVPEPGARTTGSS